MSASGSKGRKRGAVALGELVGKVLDPVTVKRGFATADLIAVWREIVGDRYADCTAPQKIVWPRGEEAAVKSGTLVLKVDGPKAILIQHELGQITERINGFLGYGAIGRIRLVQGPIAREAKVSSPDQALDGEAEERLSASLAGIGNDDLRAALKRLGRGVLTDNLKKR